MAVALQFRMGSSLTDVGNTYLDFLDRAGNAADDGWKKEVLWLCTSDCRKIVNEKVVFTTSDAFVPQLVKAHEFFGTWKIKEGSRVLASEEAQAVTVKYTAMTELQGSLLAMAVLKLNNEFQITEIDEVYNMLDTGTKV